MATTAARPGTGIYEEDERPDGSIVRVERRPDGSWRSVVEQATAGEVFDLRTPYLQQGRTTDVRSKSALMQVSVKVYAGGGENVMHAHGHEDHTFVVLEGAADFHLGTDEHVVRVKRYQGVMLPKHASYWFQAVGDENLVMLRVGASDNGFQRSRVAPDGHTIAGDSAENKTVERIERPNAYFGD
jgi:mannose-6-phosphate isomerase-like protein (cupin superfamily)